MRKLILLFLCCFALIAIYACGGEEKPANETVKTAQEYIKNGRYTEALNYIGESTAATAKLSEQDLTRYTEELAQTQDFAGITLKLIANAGFEAKATAQLEKLIADNKDNINSQLKREMDCVQGMESAVFSHRFDDARTLLKTCSDPNFSTHIAAQMQRYNIDRYEADWQVELKRQEEDKARREVVLPAMRAELEANNNLKLNDKEESKILWYSSAIEAEKAVYIMRNDAAHQLKTTADSTFNLYGGLAYTNSSAPLILRFVVNYYAKEWLSPHTLVFSTDNATYTWDSLHFEFAQSSGYSHENIDILVDAKKLAVLKDVAGAKNASIRIEGVEGKVDFTLDQKTKDRFKLIIETHEQLEATFTGKEQ